MSANHFSHLSENIRFFTCFHNYIQDKSDINLLWTLLQERKQTIHQRSIYNLVGALRKDPFYINYASNTNDNILNQFESFYIKYILNQMKIKK